MIISTRKQALAEGLKFYFTGKACKRGHIAKRYATGACFTCAQENSINHRDYRKQGGLENKDKVREINKLYRAKTPPKDRTEYHKEWYNKNREKVLAEDKIYYLENKEKILERNKEYLVKWRADNKEHLKEYGKKKRIRRRVAIYANNAKRRADRLRARPKWTDLVAIEKIYRDCPKGYHVDHIIPLNGELVCGLHVENNLQYLTAKDNLKKSNKFTPVNC